MVTLEDVFFCLVEVKLERKNKYIFETTTSVLVHHFCLLPPKKAVCFEIWCIKDQSKNLKVKFQLRNVV